MIIFKEITKIKEKISSLKKKGKIVSLVPTMGCLHQGHLSLIKEAKKKSDIVIVSIFVNEKQFNDSNDFKNYPRNLVDDVKKLQDQKVDILFCPTLKEIYPSSQSNLVNFTVDQLADNLCGKSRKNHFEGVMLIVSKLFNIINPDIAVFGEKDFQQLQIIKRLVNDLNFDIQIISVPIFRAENGLALSSRNNLIKGDDHFKAMKIYEVLSKAKKQILASKNNNIDNILKRSRIELLKYFDKVDYLQICTEDNLQIIKKFNKKTKFRIFVAVYLNQIRLIDNIALHY